MSFRAGVLAPIVVTLLAGAVHAEEKSKVPFGPFDSGTKRDVARQGTKGKARKAHPAVGDAAKVPGEGPPPPPLRPEADIPEGALDKPSVKDGSGGPNALGGDLSSNPLYLPALLYSNVITRVDGPRCSHLPTCSRFASQAVARHGAIGILMGLDRVIQPTESSALRRLPEVEGYGGVRFFDPVENYELWHPERFTGMPVKTAEVPLVLAPLPAPSVASLVSAAPLPSPTTTTP